MERKIIDIEISPDTLDETLVENAGVMWEHNAAKIIFHIDKRYAGDYRYYVEYRSVTGERVRTRYLDFNSSDNTITFEIPVEMTSLMSVECFFNIVSVDGDGNTRQVIKPKKFCLDFDPSPDTDNAIARDNDFSVNALLEAIRSGTFKGEKGDKGDAYTLTDSDRAEIAEKVNGDIYGLPFIRCFNGKGETELTGISENGQIHSLKVSAEPTNFSASSEISPVQPKSLQTVKIFIGKNEAEHLLKPEMYSSFILRPEIYSGSYYTVPIYLKPNTKYRIVRFDKTVNNCYSAIKQGDTVIFFVHTVSQHAKDDLEITTDDSGLIYWLSTAAGRNELAYKMLLEGAFYGFGIYEADKCAAITVTPDKPLYSLSKDNCDRADAVTGAVERNIEALTISEITQLSDSVAFTDGTKTLYRYLVNTAETPDTRLGYDVGCTHYKMLDRFINSGNDLSAGEDDIGVYFNREENKIYIYSDKSGEEFASFISEQNAAGTPIMLFYRMRYPITEKLEPTETVIDSGYDKVRVFPDSMPYSMHINGNISEALNYLLNTEGV